MGIMKQQQKTVAPFSPAERMTGRKMEPRECDRHPLAQLMEKAFPPNLKRNSGTE